MRIKNNSIGGANFGNTFYNVEVGIGFNKLKYFKIQISERSWLNR